jgi:hypothetical protein
LFVGREGGKGGGLVWCLRKKKEKKRKKEEGRGPRSNDL